MAPFLPQSGPPPQHRGYSETDPGRPSQIPPLGNLRPRARFSIAYYLALFLGFWLMQLYFFQASMPLKFRTASFARISTTTASPAPS